MKALKKTLRVDMDLDHLGAAHDETETAAEQIPAVLTIQIISDRGLSG